MKAYFFLLFSAWAAVGSWSIGQEKKEGLRPPTFADVPYDQFEKTKLDFWQAEGAGLRPLVVFIHGGGWIGGDKKTKEAEGYLKRGISFASINYRLTGEAILPTPVHDAARAIQFLRSKAEEWNLRKDRIVLTGGSAGACTSMWLLCHDDLADPQSEDPIKRESTRVQGAVASGGQTSIDPRQIEPWLGPNVLKHPMIFRAVGENTIEDALKNYEKHASLFKEFSPYNHVTEDDPPLFMSYGADMTLPSKDAGHGIHHPVYGVKMKEKFDSVGVPCHLSIPGFSEPTLRKDQFIDQILLGKSEKAGLDLPASDEGLAGAGPVRRYEWFAKLWSQKRAEWAKQVEKDQGAFVFLGDSITQGWGPQLKGDFGTLKVANRGISGDTTRGMLYRLQEDVLALRPAGVALLMGTNDLEEGATPEVIASNFKLIISELHRHDPEMPIVVSLVFPSAASKKRPSSQIQEINRLFQEAVKGDPKVTVIDTWTLFANENGDARVEEFPDLLHPNPKGYQMWAAALRPVLATLGFVETEAEVFSPEDGFKFLFNGKDFTGWGSEPRGREKNQATAMSGLFSGGTI